MRVFDGGEGSTSGGRSEKSSESDDLFLDDDRECWGEASVVDMLGNISRCLDVPGNSWEV